MTSIDETLKQYGNHEWNYHIFKILGQIRQESIEWAREQNSHYFVVDADNFIAPFTLEYLD